MDLSGGALQVARRPGRHPAGGDTRRSQVSRSTSLSARVQCWSQMGEPGTSSVSTWRRTPWLPALGRPVALLGAALDPGGVSLASHGTDGEAVLRPAHPRTGHGVGGGDDRPARAGAPLGRSAAARQRRRGRRSSSGGGCSVRRLGAGRRRGIAPGDPPAGVRIQHRPCGDGRNAARPGCCRRAAMGRSGERAARALVQSEHRDTGHLAHAPGRDAYCGCGRRVGRLGGDARGEARRVEGGAGRGRRRRGRPIELGLGEGAPRLFTGDGRLHRLDASSGQPEDVEDVGANPVALAVGEDRRSSCGAETSCASRASRYIPNLFRPWILVPGHCAGTPGGRLRMFHRLPAPARSEDGTRAVYEGAWFEESNPSSGSVECEEGMVEAPYGSTIADNPGTRELRIERWGTVASATSGRPSTQRPDGWGSHPSAAGGQEPGSGSPAPSEVSGAGPRGSARSPSGSSSTRVVRSKPSRPSLVSAPSASRKGGCDGPPRAHPGTRQPGRYRSVATPVARALATRSAPRRLVAIRMAGTNVCLWRGPSGLNRCWGGSSPAPPGAGHRPGRHGVVYLAEDLALERKVTLSCWRPELTVDERSASASIASHAWQRRSATRT